MTGTPDIEQLRQLLFGKDYEELLALKRQLGAVNGHRDAVAAIISEALTLRAQQDDSLSTALEPTISKTLTESIRTQPGHFADMLYPVMGPAIRKSIQQALNEALENMNRMLEQGFSLRSWKWRFDAWRTGQSYARIALLRTLVYQVEQVFLIHRESGLLLQHAVAPQAISKSPEAISGMLTAIQDFIRDSFEVTNDDNLDTLKLGELSVLIEHGPHAVTAMVVRGSAPGELRTLLADTSETIHNRFARQFTHYQGSDEDFAPALPLLEHCLTFRQQTGKKRPPWLAYLVLAGIMAALAYGFYGNYQQRKLIKQQEAAAQQEQQQLLQTLQTQLREQQATTAETQTALQALLNQQRQQSAQQQREAAANAKTINDLTQKIRAVSYPFANAQADIDPGSPMLQQLADDMLQLLQAAARSDQTLQIIIIGNTDERGGEAFNWRLANARAQRMREALLGKGVPAAILTAENAAQTAATASRKNERGVRFQVGVF